MKPPLLFWICSFLNLHHVSSADDPPSFTNLPSELLDAIVRQVVVSQRFDSWSYIDWLAGNRWAWPWTDVGMPMLKETVEEEKVLGLYYKGQSDIKQQIFTKVRTFVRIRSRLPIDCTGIEAGTLRDLAGVFESTYEECASLSESSTWKKACMAGLFGLNTLIKLLPHLSRDFCSNNKDILLQTAFVIGDIDSVDAIIGFFSLSKDKVLENLPELDIVVSGSVNFFDELLKRLPNLVITKKLGLIREASLLNRLGILKRILKVAKPAEPHELNQILDSFSQLRLFNDAPFIFPHPKGEVCYFLIVAAQHGHLPIIQCLWLPMEAMLNNAEAVVQEMMTRAGRNNHRSVIEFLMWESGGYYMNVAQHYVNDAFEPALVRGYVNIMELLTGQNNDGTLVSPGLCSPTLDEWDFREVINTNNNWDGIYYLVDLKKNGDPRFADFELVDGDNTVLCIACQEGDSNLVEYLFQKAPDGQFIFPLTNPAAQNNEPLISACWSGNLQIVQKLLERDESGNYIYRGIDPSARNYQSIVNACFGGHMGIVEFLLSMKYGKYVLPRMGGLDFTRVLLDLIKSKRMEVVELLLKTDDGKYVLPGMSGINFTSVLSGAIKGHRTHIVKWLLSMNKVGDYVLPGMNDVDATSILRIAIASHQKEIVEFLLRRALDGSYVLPGVGVTEDMLMIPYIVPEIREILEVNLDQQRIDEQKRGI